MNVHSLYLWQNLADGLGKLVRRLLRTFQSRTIGVRHGCGVHRRIHVAWIERKESHTFGCVLLVPDATHVMKRCLTRTIGAPTWIRVYRGVTRDIQHNRAASFASGSC